MQADNGPCTTCGSYHDECKCDYAREITDSLDELGVWLRDTRIRQMTIDYDNAMAQRALREYGYTR